jgi:ribosomal protein S27E
MTGSGECHVCGDTVPLDGEQAIKRFGEVLCRGCADEPVVFVAKCTNGLCGWSYRVDETEFNRGHAKTRAQQEANQHQDWKCVFEDDPTHRTEVSEVEA